MAEMDSFSLRWTRRESWWKIERLVVGADKLMKWMDIYAHTRAVNILFYFMRNQIVPGQNKASATYFDTINTTTRHVASYS